MLALEANWFAALVALLSIAQWIAIWLHARHPYALLCAGGWVGLCAYWSLLAVSAGPAPAMQRGEIALLARVLLVSSMAMVGSGKLWWTLVAWRRETCARRNST